MAILPRVIIEKGYLFCGLDVSTSFAAKSGFNFVTESAFNPANGDMSLNRHTMNRGVSGDKAAYISGGGSTLDSSTRNDDIFKMIFETEADSTIAALLDTNRRGAGGSEARIQEKGYWFGGESDADNHTNDIVGINFATEVFINPSATMAESGRRFLAGYSSDLNGYQIGGLASVGGAQTDITSFLFSTETASANPSAVLARANYTLQGLSSEFAGYTGGGTTNQRDCEKLVYSTETITDLGSGFFNANKHTDGAIAGKDQGYWCCGRATPGNGQREIHSCIFSSDTFEDTTAQAEAPNLHSLSAGQQFRQM